MDVAQDSTQKIIVLVFLASSVPAPCFWSRFCHRTALFWSILFHFWRPCLIFSFLAVKSVLSCRWSPCHSASMIPSCDFLYTCLSFFFFISYFLCLLHSCLLFSLLSFWCWAGGIGLYIEPRRPIRPIDQPWHSLILFYTFSSYTFSLYTSRDQTIHLYICKPNIIST